MSSDANLTFYHAIPSRSAIVHWMLEEIGEPFEIVLLDLQKGEHKRPSFLRINAMGKVPAIVHKGVAISEAAAICCYLADAFPEAGLSIPIGDDARGPYLRWLFFGPGCLEPAMIDRMMERPDVSSSRVGWGNLESVLGTVGNALKSGPYLLGERFTAADVVIGSGLRWGMYAGALPERPEFAAYVARLAERPALKRATTSDARLTGGSD